MLLADFISRRFRSESAIPEFDHYFSSLKQGLAAAGLPLPQQELLVVAAFLIRQLSPWDRLLIDVSQPLIRDLALAFDTCLKGEVGRNAPMIASCPGVEFNRWQVRLSPAPTSDLGQIECPGLLAVLTDGDRLMTPLAQELARPGRSRSMFVAALTGPETRGRLHEMAERASISARHFPSIEFGSEHPGQTIVSFCSEMHAYEV